MSQLVEKILRSGIVDRHTVELMERYGLIEPGSSEKVNEKALENATREQLERLAEELAVEAEREFALKETVLDLNQMRWPTRVALAMPEGNVPYDALIDRMGRYYFRIQDISRNDFIPGRILVREGKGQNEAIAEVTDLYIGDQVIAVQVSVV